MTYQSVKPSQATRDKHKRESSETWAQLVAHETLNRLERRHWRRARRERLGYGYPGDLYGLED